MSAVDVVIVGVFLALLFAAGSYFYNWVRTPDDLYVAGRQLTPFILAATITATNVNLYSFVGQSGVAYKHGISILWQTWTGNMALVFSGLFVLPVLRRLRVRTVPEFLEMRYGPGVRALVGVLWILRLSFWLGVVLYTAAVAAQTITGFHNYTAWLLIFSVITVLYTMMGGMWSVALTDVLQFILMMTGALILLPLAMAAVGWWPGLVAKIEPGHLELVTQTGSYNWLFVLAIFVLGIEWASVDQGLLQRAFSAKDVRTVAKGLVLGAIITTPFALMWNLPGLAASVLHPGLANPDSAVPTIIRELAPAGVLGLIVCGLLASQMSTIDSNLNAVATLFTNDVYSRFFNRESTPKQMVWVIRLVTLIAGLFMIGFSYAVPKLGGAVSAYLTIIAIMDMPLFVIAILYGLLWRRSNSVGAVLGYLIGAAAGAYALFGLGFDFNAATFVSAGFALVATPIFAYLAAPPPSHYVEKVFAARRHNPQDPGDMHTIPASPAGRASLGLWLGGLLVFVVGVVMGKWGLAAASPVAVAGMLLYFLGGWLRLQYD